MKQTVDELIAEGFLDSDYEGSSGDFSSSDEEESEFYDTDFDIDADEIDEYFICEELVDTVDDDNKQIIDAYTFDDEFAVYDLVNDPKYEICIYQRVIVRLMQMKST